MGPDPRMQTPRNFTPGVSDETPAYWSSVSTSFSAESTDVNQDKNATLQW